MIRYIQNEDNLQVLYTSVKLNVKLQRRRKISRKNETFSSNFSWKGELQKRHGLQLLSKRTVKCCYSH